MNIQKKIAIILLNYNTSDDCRKCIELLNTQTGVDIEIIVVDNCSQKQDVEKLLAFCSEQGIVFLQSNENKGYSAGNNIGLRYASEQGLEYALIINPDVELHQKEYLQTMVERFSSDNNIVVIGTDIVNVEGHHQNPLREVKWFEELFWCIEWIKSKVHHRLWYITNYKENGYCDKLSGCCFMILLSFVEKIGFFDEKTFLYCEEPILAKQVKKKKKKMFYIANIQAFHNHISSKKENSAKRIKRLMDSRNYYLNQYSEHPLFAIKLISFSLWLHQMIFSILNKLK